MNTLQRSKSFHAMFNIVDDYMELRKNMSLLIKESGFKNAYLAEQIGMPAPTFSVKKQRGNWTPDEMKKILDIIESEKLEDLFLLELMRAESNEPRYPIDDLIKRMGW